MSYSVEVIRFYLSFVPSPDITYTLNLPPRLSFAAASSIDIMRTSTLMLSTFEVPVCESHLIYLEVRITLCLLEV